MLLVAGQVNPALDACCGRIERCFAQHSDIHHVCGTLSPLGSITCMQPVYERTMNMAVMGLPLHSLSLYLLIEKI